MKTKQIMPPGGSTGEWGLVTKCVREKEAGGTKNEPNQVAHALAVLMAPACPPKAVGALAVYIIAHWTF